LHALDDFRLRLEAFGLLDRDDALIADPLVVCLNRRTAARVEQAVRIVSEASIFWAGV
jgi:hypothetical protein